MKNLFSAAKIVKQKKHKIFSTTLSKIREVRGFRKEYPTSFPDF